MILLERLEKFAQKLGEVEKELSNPGVVKDQANYQKQMKELARLRPFVQALQDYKRIEKELGELNQSLSDKNLDSEIRKLYEEEAADLNAKKEKIIQDLENELFKESDPNAGRDVIIEVRAGTGGEEAALFGADLFRAYSKYAAEHKLAVEIMDSNLTGKGGVKEIIFAISGVRAYSFFKYESGIHRVQRVPETEASGRIHTSAVTVAVLPEADEKEVEIESKDLKIDVYRASGAGGQHVNKTESAVRITHIPTGTVVACQDERSQHKNKTKAMRILRARIYEMMQEKQHQEVAKARKEQVGSGDRSGKIRTYNFPDQRVTDHRIGLTLHSLNDILDGHLDELVQALERHDREKKLTDAA
ncbi:MAG: peptide chain release factor 1 [Candidatus Omnitrophica bacterium]|nr:peptide chain release factor 1 [Candidatus Omnitrophota bacterium]